MRIKLEFRGGRNMREKRKNQTLQLLVLGGKNPFWKKNKKENIFKYENIRMEQIKVQFNFETFYLYYHFLATS
jgi:hypothetical protein